VIAASPLLSAQWFRVAALRPRLEPQLRVERISYRRQIWYVLVRADGSRSFRLNAAAYAFVGRCNGKLSVHRLWELLLAEHKDDAPSQDELLQLLARLHGAALVSFDRKPDFGPQGTIHAAGNDGAPRAANSLLSYRIPLGRPDAWLSRRSLHLGWLFGSAALTVWAGVVICGLVAALLNAGTLMAHAQVWMGTPRMLVMVWIAYPAVKALHELAHALALKHCGGKVPEWGVTVMMFTPVPYVDASAAAALPGVSQRVLVSAAGIMVELFLAALALAVALNAEPGWLRDLSFAVFFIGTVSTLLINGNPLLRFDGYHALSDALELPNLASRSARHWIEWLRLRVLRAPLQVGIVPAQGELPWLWGYAPAALIYRLAISAALVGWLGKLSFLLGSAIALYLVWVLAAKPLLALFHFLRGTALAEAERMRATRRAALAAGVLVSLATLLPLPFSSVVQGVVWTPDQAMVRAETEGFIAAIHVVDGAPVQSGQLLFTLQSPVLLAEQARLEGHVTALETEHFQALRSDPSRAIGIEHELAAATLELARVQERVSQLAVRAHVDGVVAINHVDDLSGRFVKQGSLLAHILTDDPTIVRAAIPQEEAALVQSGSRAVGVRLVEASDAAWRGELLRDVTGSVARLPSAALGDRSGGAIVTDPGDKQGLTPAQGVVLADVQLPGRHSAQVGARAWVRFDHGFTPLVMQAARRVQQLFLKHFNPSE
jgi:putative peptide zinc metalloprotease protein